MPHTFSHNVSDDEMDHRVELAAATAQAVAWRKIAQELQAELYNVADAALEFGTVTVKTRAGQDVVLSPVT